MTNDKFWVWLCILVSAVVVYGLYNYQSVLLLAQKFNEVLERMF